MSMEAYKQKIVQFYLQKYENDVLLVAKKLDIGKSTIYRMLKETAAISLWYFARQPRWSYNKFCKQNMVLNAETQRCRKQI